MDIREDEKVGQSIKARINRMQYLTAGYFDVK